MYLIILQVGDPKDNIRKAIRCIFRQVCMIFPASKMFSLIIDGIKSKNSKQRTGRFTIKIYFFSFILFYHTVKIVKICNAIIFFEEIILPV